MGKPRKKEKGLYPSSRLNGYIHQLPVVCKNISTKSDRHITQRCWGSRAIQPNKMDNQTPPSPFCLICNLWCNRKKLCHPVLGVLIHEK